MPPTMEGSVPESSAPDTQIYLGDDLATPAFMPAILESDHSLLGPASDGMGFFSPMQNLFQDMDFAPSWDMDYNSFSLPLLGLQGPSPLSSHSHSYANPALTPNDHGRVAFRDASVGHAAFKRYSPWLWEPNHQEDYVQQQKEGLTIDEQALAQSPAFDRMMDNTPRNMLLKPQHRDRIFALVLAQNRDVRKVPSFPTLDLLNYLFQAHFVQDEQQLNSWVHASSLDAETAMPELLGAIIANGATFVSIPAVWQFGLALHEVIRLATANEVGLVLAVLLLFFRGCYCNAAMLTRRRVQFEARNASTRNLGVLQASLMWLETGKWSGFKRTMEIAESFLQPHLTVSSPGPKAMARVLAHQSQMLRRANMFSAPIDSLAVAPHSSDPPEVVASKWRNFIARESWKRQVLPSPFGRCAV